MGRAAHLELSSFLFLKSTFQQLAFPRGSLQLRNLLSIAQKGHGVLRRLTPDHPTGYSLGRVFSSAVRCFTLGTTKD